MYNDDFLLKKINERKQQNAFRQLRFPQAKIDFCSNDYLGIVKNNLLSAHPIFNQPLKTGSTGSRLLAGNYTLVEEAEKKIATFHNAAAALIFNSGYDANTGVLSSLPQRGDTVFYDAISHASIRDGIRLSFANTFPFAHNDMEDLEKKLQSHAGNNIFIVTESVFSMDGDTCPLKELVSLAKKYNAHLIIDEAHAIGVVGEKGQGLVQHLYLQDEIFCRIYTFGKACGCHGAAVAGSQLLKDYLINFARSFIYSTAIPEHAVAAITASYDIFSLLDDERKQLEELVNYFQKSSIKFQKFISHTAIQVVMVPGNDEVKQVAKTLQDAGFDIRPILYPTVPKGSERLRIVLHSFNTLNNVKQLVELLS